jgi:glycerol dehydrogenase
MPMVDNITRGFGGPSRYIQGPGELKRIEEYSSIYGTNVFALIDNFLHTSLDIELKSIYESTDSSITNEKFNGECTINEIERIKKIIKNKNHDVLIGIGGGKTIDTAKAVANAVDIPIIVAPTIASTDAPTSALSIIYTDDGKHDKVIFFKRNADMVLVDTAIIVKAPVRMLVSGMGDALSTYFEARANSESDNANYIGKGYRRCKAALAIAKVCFDILMEDGLEAKLSAECGVCSEAFENIVEANILLSGLGFENSGCAAAHGINDGLTILPETKEYYHGEKVAFGVICQLILENRPQLEIIQVLDFCLKIGLPVTLSDIGIKKIDTEMIMSIAAKTAEKGAISHAEPFKITPEIVFTAIIAADAIGNYYKKVKV